MQVAPLATLSLSPTHPFDARGVATAPWLSPSTPVPPFFPLPPRPSPSPVARSPAATSSRESERARQRGLLLVPADERTFAILLALADGAQRLQPLLARDGPEERFDQLARV